MDDTQALTIPGSLSTIGPIADQIAAMGVFEDYQSKCTANTARRQKNDLAVFSAYLQEAGVILRADDLYASAEAWRGLSYGFVKGFVIWQLNQGYAIGSVNVRLATVKTYCALATEAGVIDASTLDMIKLVKGYAHKTGRNVDNTRTLKRRGHKKASPAGLNEVQASALKTAVDASPLARRDALLMCLLLEHGLRVGEIAGLRRANLDLARGEIVFYREKVDKVQTHRLTPETLKAAMAYLPHCTGLALFTGYQARPLTTRAINSRIGTLGRRVGVQNLAPHDCRHYWATVAMRNKTDVKTLQEAGGWSSPAMPLRYAEASEIANEGVKLA